MVETKLYRICWRMAVRDNYVSFQVIMSDRASAERACKEQNPIIDGRKANVNLAILGAKPRGNVQTGKLMLVYVVC